MAKRPLVEQYEALIRGDHAKTSTNGHSSQARATARLEALCRDGYVKIPSLLAPHMLLALRGAAAYTTQRARDGKWPHIRTVPKQFPPWPSSPPPEGIWGVQHLLHPDMPVRDLFAEVYFSDAVLDVVKDLLGGVRDDELVMELFNLLVSPSGERDFELCWHRDDIRPDLSPEEEAQQLEDKSPAGRQFHAQYNIALTEDTSLVVVPGSHRRTRTEVERNAGQYEAELPGQVLVGLLPGDSVFASNPLSVELCFCYTCTINSQSILINEVRLGGRCLGWRPRHSPLAISLLGRQTHANEWWYSMIAIYYIEASTRE